MHNAQLGQVKPDTSRQEEMKYEIMENEMAVLVHLTTPEDWH